MRDSLRAWQYDQTTELLDSASTALDDRDAVLDAAAGAGLTPPTTMQTAFEGPRGFAAASAEAEAQLAAIDAFRSAAATRSMETDPVARIGLWNSDPNGALGRAAEAFRTGDLEDSVAASAYARTTWTTAADVGRSRVLAIGGLLAAVLLAAWLLVRGIRDRRGHRRRRLVMAHPREAGPRAGRG